MSQADDGDTMTLDEMIERVRGLDSLTDPQVPVVFGCLLRIISRAQALPVRVVDAAGNVYPTPAWVRQPSPVWSWRDVVSQAVWSLVMYGDLYTWPKFDAARHVSGVIVVSPEEAKPMKVVQRVRRILPEYAIAWNSMIIPEIQHTRYLARPGLIRGLGAKRAKVRAQDITAMAEETLLRHFSQGARLQVVFSTDKVLDPDQLKDATRRVRAQYEGIGNSWRPAVLSGGVKVSVLSQTGEQAQYLELSKWADARIASQIFGVDPSLLGINLPGSTLTYSNAVDREANLWRDALRPVITAMEDAFSRLLPAGRRFEFVETGLLAGGPRDRVAYAKELATINQMLGAWVVSPDQILDAIGLPTINGMPELIERPGPTPARPEGDENAQQA